jgi:hypothetical protein
MYDRGLGDKLKRGRGKDEELFFPQGTEEEEEITGSV